MESARIPLDRLTWARWRRAMRDLMRSEVGGRVKLLFGALLALLLAINGLNVVNSYVGRDFMTAIEQRSMSGFLTKAVLYVGVFAVSTVAAVIYRFTEERLGLLWRRLVHAPAHRALPAGRHLLPAARAGRDPQPGPAHRRRRAHVHHDDAVARCSCS